MRLILVSLTLLFTLVTAGATTFPVATLAKFNAAVSQLAPGDEIVIANGTYAD